ncbi:long-chain fatty aldehyde decarbonylase [Rubidibacter lacunae KORDI 51-2]|uniref:Aldehyde decarbonylase n=1 Tax=Rubidibacter lacunae KORDI 51-2 TaxID=582515 RepID=U5DFA3_9CHRO|nr:aldehyde oxygenase (deformylating) [Rubidibacter lacunae]ERN39977.1 long-chain fatty aldehyde decarbonylase [Rubidibacter lacunae KORDI 51-2]
MQELAASTALDYDSDVYKDAYSRINAIVIEGEMEAKGNYTQLATLLPDSAEDLTQLAKMEGRHMKGFQACGKNLSVTPDMDFARDYFARLHGNFQQALADGDVVACFLIQSLIIECFAIAAYNIYIPVADPFARKITEGVVKDEYLHLNFGEVWLREHFEDVKERLLEANKQNLPIVWQMLNQVEDDAAVLGMGKEELIEDFMVAYSEALSNIGFNAREIARMSVHGLAAA